MYRLLPSPYLVFLLFWSLFSLNSYADADQETDEQTAFSVPMDEKTQTEAGIKTQKLHVSQLTPEIKTFATRVDLTPLIQMRSEYIHSRAELETMRSKLEQAKRNVQRSTKLLREKAVSPRKLHEQKTQLKIVQIRFDSAQQQTDNILLHSQLKWGKGLGKIILTNDLQSSSMQDMLDRPLYLIYLPIQNTTPSKTIFLQAFANREQALPATLVGSAPPANTGRQQAGTPFYYLSDHILTNQQQRVAAWIPVTGEKLSGVIIPTSSLVWHLGQAYIYLQLDTELFKRIKITDKRLISNASYFIQNALQQGDILVDTGAQLLLSEEFRGQIPDEEDDD